jgi:hypothetical protein
MQQVDDASLSRKAIVQSMQNQWFRNQFKSLLAGAKVFLSDIGRVEKSAEGNEEEWKTPHPSRFLSHQNQPGRFFEAVSKVFSPLAQSKNRQGQNPDSTACRSATRSTAALPQDSLAHKRHQLYDKTMPILSSRERACGRRQHASTTPAGAIGGLIRTSLR